MDASPEKVPLCGRLAAMMILTLFGCATEVEIGYVDTSASASTAPTDTGSGPPVPLDSAADTSTGTVSPPSTDTGVETDSRTAPDSDTGTGQDACDAPTMYVEGRYLHDVCGNRVIPIGVNEMVVWSDDRTGGTIFPEIKQTGANTVRFAWATGVSTATDATVAEFDQALANCIANRMIPFPEIHDLVRTLQSVPQAVGWWTQPEVVAVVQKHQRFLVITIANGPGEANIDDTVYIETYAPALEEMRAAGIQVPVVIEANDTGSDITMLQRTFSALQARDPIGNLMFSAHLWWPADDGSTNRIIDELQASADLDMPLIVSEFAPMATGCVGDIDVSTILSQCRAHGFGFFPWSWGRVENTDCAYLGMTTDGIYDHWRASDVYGPWGQSVAVTDPNSIRNQSVEVPAFAIFE